MASSVLKASSGDFWFDTECEEAQSAKDIAQSKLHRKTRASEELFEKEEEQFEKFKENKKTNYEWIQFSTETFKDQPVLPSESSFPPNISEVRRAIQDLENTNCGKGEIDNISSELIKFGSEKLHEHIFEILEKILESKKVLTEEEIEEDSKNILDQIISSVLCNKLSSFESNSSKRLFTLIQTIEKATVFQVDIHFLLINFEQHFESLDEENFGKIMESLGISKGLYKLCWLFRNCNKLSSNICSLLVDNVINTCRESDGLRLGSILMENTVQVFRNANRIVVMGRKKEDIENILLQLERASNKGLEINFKESKYMLYSKGKITNADSKKIEIRNRSFQIAKELHILGIIVDSSNNISDEVIRAITIGLSRYREVFKFLDSTHIEKDWKIQLYHHLIRPEVLHGSASWLLTEADCENLSNFETAILRDIYGPKSRETLHEIYEYKTIVDVIKIERLIMLGNIKRMAFHEPASKCVFSDKVEGGRQKRGRPKINWMKAAEKDLRTLKILGTWKDKASGENEWNKFIENSFGLNKKIISNV